MSDYFTDLAAALAARGVPRDEIAATVDDLAAFAAESGRPPAEEFGPAAGFAARLAPASDAEPAPAGEQTWRWTADAFQDVRRLNAYGDEGWELRGIDGAGRFVTHRDPDRPLRWEYRRALMLPGAERPRTEPPAAEGWERCGTWVCFAYYKRPRAASAGPAGERPDAPPRPRRRVFFGAGFYVFVTCYALAVAAVVTAALTFGGALSSVLKGTAIGAILGLAVALATTLSRRR
ncbi:hypothetical protein [Actinomadura atramentaria]|uniref:hypothetical protein n=1 Tax=Actinomadura atramentaria TaxID=1990 RepID=UPI000378A26C|nr:hypothetical protein [Actinomadura atramentaria]